MTERRAGSASTQRPFDLDELPDLLERLGAHLTGDEAARLRSRLVELSSPRSDPPWDGCLSETRVEEGAW